ncbi:hypothetical protein PR202_gb23655 [Eleusine coracana subsp. coracana]|uniref:Protein kinase domain-containing protein n=1 Tax=Eleusine coracana subsp. coracana TaxID=191504 RepID=A0AAV5FJH7_ELECO|nr:hypothetical protein PR202_gb23655 [Eleusine coracana subsp. coracana]
MEPSVLTFQDLEEATHDFSNYYVLGEGKHGKTYKANLGTGEAIAVKLLGIDDPVLDDEGLQNEFHKLRRLRHRNLVGCLNYCYETRLVPEKQHQKTFRALCFDLVPNGNLTRYISCMN